MIRFICMLLLISVTITKTSAQSIHALSLTNIDGAQVSLNTFLGQKVLFIIAPVKISDSLKVDELATFNARYGDTIKLVGIMSVEDGYADSNKALIKALYQAKGVNLLLTQGMHTRKAAGASQTAIMKWLTDRNLNKRFDADGEGVGQKFFIDENGKLYSVLIAQTHLFSPAVERNIYRKL